MSFAPTKVQLEVLIKWHKDCNNLALLYLYMYQHHSVNVNVTGQFQVEL